MIVHAGDFSSGILALAIGARTLLLAAALSDNSIPRRLSGRARGVDLLHIARHPGRC